MSPAKTPSKTAAEIIHALLTDRKHALNCPTTGEFISFERIGSLPEGIVERLVGQFTYERHVFWMGFFYVLVTNSKSHERSVHVFNQLSQQVATAYSSTNIYKYVA